MVTPILTKTVRLFSFWWQQQQAQASAQASLVELAARNVNTTVAENVVKEKQKRARALVFASEKKDRREVGKGRTQSASKKQNNRSNSAAPIYPEDWVPKDESSRTPRCNCGHYCKVLTVRKETANKGKVFFACREEWGSPNNCNHFIWKTNHWNEIFEWEGENEFNSKVSERSATHQGNN